MSQKVLSKTNFYFNFYENKGVPNVYSSIHYKDNAIPIYSQSIHDEVLNVDTFVVELFPNYFDFQINNEYVLDLQKIFRVKGYCISLDQLESVENYLRAHFKPNFRTSLRRRVKGLEKCFNVNYKMLYGNIEQDEYDFLMNELRTMLIRRFDQRNDENMALGRWKDYYADTYKLINEKRASLYVIYDGAKPIQISLSYHYDKILFLAIPSYDIDYAKFGLGNISVLKLLEWCIANSYEILDMGFGAFDYKVKWCNKIYDFEHHLFYTKSSVLSKMLLFYITVKTKLINYLISKKVNVGYHKLKTTILGKKESGQIRFNLEKVDNHTTELNTCKIIYPLKDDSFAFLRRAIYDFLYTHQEHASKVEVYEFERSRTYFFKGENQTFKITFEI